MFYIGTLIMILIFGGLHLVNNYDYFIYKLKIFYKLASSPKVDSYLIQLFCYK